MTVTRYNEQGEEAPDGVVVFYSDYLGEKQRADAAESELEAVRGELRNERLLKRLDKVRAEQAEERLEAVRKRTIEAEKDAERYRWLEKNWFRAADLVHKTLMETPSRNMRALADAVRAAIDKAPS